MKIANISVGFQELPGKVTMNIFTAGCSLKCKGCHNPELQDFNLPSAKDMTADMIINEIDKRSGLIDAVCWLGGEPTEQKDFEAVLLELKEKRPNVRQCLYTGRDRSALPIRLQNCFDHIKAGRWMGKPISDPTSNQKLVERPSEGWAA